jgi:uncharacterized protein YbjT (DUF2867 family)
MKVLVLGGTGYVGRNLVSRLVERGYKVRCLVRDPNKADLAGSELLVGDAGNETEVAGAVDGVERIVYLIHSMTASGGDFGERDEQIARTVARAARRSKVEQIVYLGGLGRRDQDQTPHLQSRHTVAETLRQSEIPLTELRAAVVVGAGSASFEMIRYLVSRLPVMICPKWVNVRTQPIAIRDVLDYIEQSLERAEVRGETIDIGGPDIVSYRDMMVTVAQCMGRRRLIIPVPVLTPWLSSHWVNLVTPVAAPLARALIESVRSETICENDLARRIFDIEPLGFRDAVAHALRAHSEKTAAAPA